MIMSLKKIVEESDTRAGKIFNLSMQGLIILSLITFSLETLPDLSPEASKWLGMFEMFSVTAFTVEYLLRIWVADRATKFIFSFGGLVDLLAILPFFIAVGVDLRGVRVVRLFRLFRIFKVFRYNQALERLVRAFKTVQTELVLFAAAIACVLYVAAVGIYYFENPVQPEKFSSIFDSLWWAVITLTTVGYGDAIPVTVGGRVFAGMLVFVGIGIVAVPSGLLASALTQVVNPKDDDKEH